MSTPRLPEEVLLSIFSLFQAPESDTPNWFTDSACRSTLASLCLVSKTFHSIAVSALYQTIDLRSHFNDELRPLVRTLIREPSLAGLVKKLRLASWQTRDDFEMDRLNPRHFAPALLTEFQAAAEDASSSQQHNDAVKRDLAITLEDAEVALLLSRCKALEFLEFDAPYDCRNTLFVAQLRLNSESSCIRRLEVHHWDTEGATDISTVEPLLWLPQLHSLSGRMLACEEETRFSEGTTSALKTIRLADSLVDGPGLSMLLSLCQALEDLSIEWGSATVGTCIFSFDELGRALRARGRMLKRLCFDTAMFEDFEYEHNANNLGSLLPLEHLQELILPFRAILSEFAEDEGCLLESLPGSLAKLVVTTGYGTDEVDEEDGFDERLSTFLASDRHATLNTFRMQRTTPYDEARLPDGWSNAESNESWLVLSR